MAKCKSLARSNQGQVLGGGGYGGYGLSVKAFSYYIAIGIDLSTQNQTDDSAHIRMLPSETRLFFDFFYWTGSQLTITSLCFQVAVASMCFSARYHQPLFPSSLFLVCASQLAITSLCFPAHCF